MQPIICEETQTLSRKPEVDNSGEVSPQGLPLSLVNAPCLPGYYRENRTCVKGVEF